MNGKSVKLLRGQVRQAVKEMLPQVLGTETIQSIHKDLTGAINSRLDNITKVMENALNKLDERSKDVQSYVVRNMGVPIASQATATQEGTNLGIQPESERNMG